MTLSNQSLLHINTMNEFAQDGALILNKETPVSRILVQITTNKEVLYPFFLFLIYWNKSKNFKRIKYTFWKGFNSKYLVPIETTEYDNFLCKEITFEYQDADPSDAKNEELTFSLMAMEINDIERKRYNEDLNDSQ